MPPRGPLPFKRLTVLDAAYLGADEVIRRKKEVRKIRNQRYAQGSGSKLLLQKKGKVVFRLMKHWVARRQGEVMLRWIRSSGSVSPPREVLPSTKIPRTPPPNFLAYNPSLATHRATAPRSSV